MESKSDDSMFSIMIMAIFAVAGIAVLGPTLQRIFAATPMAQSYAAQAYVGSTDYHVLEADGQLRWISLSTPWITATFFNDGPDSAYVAVNNPDAMVELKKGESQYADFSFAQRRIEILFYKTDLGKRARVRVEGKY